MRTRKSVALTPYRGVGSVREAIAGCDGLAGLRPGAKVLVKPNLVGWDDLGPYPPWGVLTTSAVVDEVCAALRDEGAGEIVVGEGSVECPAVGSSTQGIFERLGYKELTKRYGARLVDFNAGEHFTVELAPGHEVKVTRAVSECDFFVDVPVLKTHGITRVSLGMKNLKGLLHKKSKGYCHHPEKLLDFFIARLAETFAPDLTVIDGIYDLEQGALHFGRARRRNVIVASRDLYSADVIGAALLGYCPDEIAHLSLYLRRNRRTNDPSDLKIHGTMPEACPMVKWDFEWLPDGSAPAAFAKQGITGLILPKYDHTLCTGCSYLFNPLMLILMSSERKDFPHWEVLHGAVMPPSGHAAKTFLFGKCQIQLNRNAPNAIPIPGCPPRLDDLLRVLQQNGIPCSREMYDSYRKHLMERYLSKPEVFQREHFFLEQ